MKGIQRIKRIRAKQRFKGAIMSEVGRYGWDWDNDLKPWLAQILGSAKFGDPAFDWSPDAGRELGREFLSEASTW